MTEMPDFDTVVNPRQRRYAYESTGDAVEGLARGAIAQEDLASLLENVAGQIRRTVNAGPSVRIRAHIGVVRVAILGNLGWSDGQGR